LKIKCIYALSLSTQIYPLLSVIVSLLFSLFKVCFIASCRLGMWAFWRFSMSRYPKKHRLCTTCNFLTSNYEKFTDGPHPVISLSTSPVNTEAIRAFVLAIAGIIFLATPIVSI
jgi:hypothetical protein